MAQKKLSKTRQKIHELYEKNELSNLLENQTRARSLTVGTTTGGIIEVGMRGDHTHLWYLLHPVEAVEIMQSIAAAAGIEIAMRPKQDFTTWRSWDLELPGALHWVGAAPWQLSDEQKNQLKEAKSKNIKSIQEAKDEVKDEPE